MSAGGNRLVPTDLASRAALLSLSANAGLMVLKLGVGVMTGSTAVLSDGIDSAQDVVAAGIVLASVRYGARPADLTHPYGHGRAETLAAGLQSFLIAGGGVYIVFHSLQRLVHPPSDIGASAGLIAMLIAAVVNLLVIQYTGRVARITGSPAIRSDVRHLWTNVVQATAVMLGLALVLITGRVVFDALVALALGVYLLGIALTILRSAAADVLDASLDEDEIDFVRGSILAERDAIAGFHRLRTRRSGQSRHVDFHLIVAPDMTVLAAHAIADRIEERIRAHWPGAVTTVHIEPDDGRYRGALEPPDAASAAVSEPPGGRA